MNIAGIAVGRRRFIILNTLLVTLVAAIVCVLLPKEYKSRTTILPPESQTSFNGFAGLSVAQIANAVTNFALPVMATPSDLYASMLRSETILRAAVDSLDLKNIYDSETEWLAVQQLQDRITIKVLPEGIVELETVARDPELAARIANFLILELNRLNIDIQSRKGGFHADFLTQRIQRTEEDLQASLKKLREFQEEHMAISLELQSAALIENLAQQKANLTSAEIELELLSKTLRTDHPQLLTQRLRVNEIRSKLHEIERGAESGSDSILSALDIPLDQIPDLSLQYSILRRNVRIHELIYEVLAQQLEMSRIQERKDTPLITVLDPARPAERSFRPRIVRIVVAAFLLGFLASVSLAVAYDRLRSAENSNQEAVTRARDILTAVKRRPLG